MRNVYACDFCDETNESPILMKKHEDECECNPKFKLCHSCEYFGTSYGYEVCLNNGLSDPRTIPHDYNRTNMCENYETIIRYFN